MSRIYGVDTNYVINQLITANQLAMLKLFEKGIRKNAKPIIKGEISRGKLKWRGIYYVTEKATFKSWMEQRGKRITDIYKPSMLK